MFARALYYPYIHIPDNLWLRRAILYWDKINPIVPWEIEKEIHEKHISRELKSYGLLDFIHPEDTLSSADGEQLSSFFLNKVDSEEFRKFVPEKRNYNRKIHKDKFTYALLSELKGRDLYKFGDGPWLLLENHTGILYMGFLASYLANRLNLEPITDDKLYQNGFLWPQLVPSNRPELFVSFVLEELLPAPREEVPVKRIIEFKEKHERELLTFRKAIRDTARSLESVTNELEYRRKLESVKDELREQCLILDRKLKDNRLETILCTCEALLKPSLPNLGAIGIGTISLPIGLGILGASAVIKILREVHNGQIRRRSILESSHYSYVYNVKKKLA